MVTLNIKLDGTSEKASTEDSNKVVQICTIYAQKGMVNIFLVVFFTTLSFATMLAELRKHSLGLVLAHQYLHQLEPDILHAVLGNVGTLISFRVGAEDASILAREFFPTFDVHDLLNLPNRRFYLKLMIDGTPSRPFSAELLPRQ